MLIRPFCISRKRIIKTMTPIIKKFQYLPNLSISEMIDILTD